MHAGFGLFVVGAAAVVEHGVDDIEIDLMVMATCKLEVLNVEALAVVWIAAVESDYVLPIGQQMEIEGFAVG